MGVHTATPGQSLMDDTDDWYIIEYLTLYLLYCSGYLSVTMNFALAFASRGVKTFDYCLDS